MIYYDILTGYTHIVDVQTISEPTNCFLHVKNSHFDPAAPSLSPSPSPLPPCAEILDDQGYQMAINKMGAALGGSLTFVDQKHKIMHVVPLDRKLENHLLLAVLAAKELSFL